jgi:hypothetical protein
LSSNFAFRYFHPERPNGIRFGAADRLIAKMHEENQQKQFGNAKHTLATSKFKYMEWEWH